MIQIPKGATHRRGKETSECVSYYCKVGNSWAVWHSSVPEWINSKHSNTEIECMIKDGVIQKISEPIDAPQILMEGYNCIADRASERDTEAERSMAATVQAFNVIYGTELTEVHGWQFMALLKMVRARGGDLRMDDYIDQAAYAALAGEAAHREQNG